jgi:hypothetical protein
VRLEYDDRARLADTPGKNLCDIYIHARLEPSCGLKVRHHEEYVTKNEEDTNRTDQVQMNMVGVKSMMTIKLQRESVSQATDVSSMTMTVQTVAIQGTLCSS